MRFQGGPMDGRDCTHEPRASVVKVAVLKPMTLAGSDEDWRPARHSRRPHAEQLLRENFFNCHDRSCREMSHYMWSAIYRFTPPDALVFVREEEPWLTP